MFSVHLWLESYLQVTHSCIFVVNIILFLLFSGLITSSTVLASWATTLAVAQWA